MESYSVPQGRALTLDVTLKDAEGVTVTGYTGAEALATVVWAGGDREAATTPPTTWYRDPITGVVDSTYTRVTIAISGTATGALDPGRYQVATTLTDTAGAPWAAYAATLDITPTSAAGADPKSYCTYQDLLDYGGTWLENLATDADQAGFAEKIGRARTWLEDCIQAHYRTGGFISAGVGPTIGGGRSDTMTRWLAADSLMVTDQIKECCAHYALALICRKQVGGPDSGVNYAGLARFHRSEAEALAVSLAIDLDTNGDGSADFSVDMGSIGPLYG